MIPQTVRGAFGLDGPSELLPGGVSGAHRVGDTVVKPVADAAEAGWVQRTFAGLDPDDDVGWARPCAATDDRWVVDGWIANEFVVGLRPLAPDWPAIVDAGRRFHRVTANIEPPRSMLDARAHRWARGERHAFDEEPVALTADAASIDTELKRWCGPDPTPPQVVHVDLATNLFRDQAGALVVLDIAPGFRSPAYCTAVVVADALLWSGAAPDLVDVLGPRRTARPLLARALRFRLVTEQIAVATGERPAHRADLDPYRRVMAALSGFGTSVTTSGRIAPGPRIG